MGSFDSDSGKYKSTEGGLTITNVTLQNSGQYTCRAEVLSTGHFDEIAIMVVVYA